MKEEELVPFCLNFFPHLLAFYRESAYRSCERREKETFNNNNTQTNELNSVASRRAQFGEGVAKGER